MFSFLVEFNNKLHSLSVGREKIQMTLYVTGMTSKRYIFICLQGSPTQTEKGIMKMFTFYEQNVKLPS